jgi:type I restriction-modification system DNA methylase subunit
MQSKSVKNDGLIALFNSCLNILRNDEGITGDKALQNLSYILILQLIESKIDDEFINYDYDFKECDKIKILSCIKFSNLVNEPLDNIKNILNKIWILVLSVNPLTKKIFKDTMFFNINKDKTFKKIFIELQKIDLKNIDYDILGSGYEEVIKHTMTGKVLGQFFTQPIIKNIMIELINPKLNPDGKIESMCDPTMGTGGFLITYIRNILKQSVEKKIKLDWDNIKSSIYGKEINEDTYQLAISNMLISTGHIFDVLEYGNSITEPINQKFDIIMANPPFGIKGINYDEIKSPIKTQYFPFKSKSAVLLFLQAIIFMLKIDGRCTVVLPNGQDLFSRNKSIYQIREYLMKTCDLQEIIYLPADVFENTSIKTCIFYFVKKKEGTDVITVNDKKKTREYKFIDNHETKSVKFYEYDIKENKKNLLLDVSIELISKNSYSLNYVDYKVEEKKEYKKNIELKTIGDICKFLPKSKRHASYGKNEGKFPFFKSSMNINSYVDEPDYKEESLIVGTGGNANIKYSNSFSCSTDNFIITSSTSNIKYLYYYLLYNINKLENGFIGVGLKHISKDYLSSIQIPIPSLEIQTQIVEYLDFLDSCNETSNVKIEELKILNSYCVNNQMIFGVNDTKTLGDIFGNKTSNYIIIQDDIKYNIVGLSSKGFSKISKKLSGIDIKIKRQQVCKENQFIISKILNGCYGFVTEDTKDNIISSEYWLFCINNSIVLNKYISYIFESYILSELEHISDGVGIPRINKEKFYNIQIPIPSLEIQNQIVEYCDKNNDIINLLEKEIENNKKLGSDYIKSILS